MAATILADGTYELTNVPAIADVAIIGELLKRWASACRRVDAELRLRIAGGITPSAPYELVERIRASIVVWARCSRAVGGRGCRCPAATTSAPARSTCTWRARGAGREFEFSHGYLEAPPTAAGARDARVPERRGHREHLDGGRAAKGTTIDNAAREPEIADLSRSSTPWAPRSPGSAPRRSSSRASTGPCGRSTTGWCRTDRGRHVPGGRRRRRWRADPPRRPPRAHGPADPAGRNGRGSRPPATASSAWPPGGCGRSTCRRCRTPAWPPTTSRC